eukprot:3820527-Rhodomonas_salina.1
MSSFRNVQIPFRPTLAALMILLQLMSGVSGEPGCQRVGQSWGYAHRQQGSSCTELLRIRGGRKGVSAKHTASEVAAKTALATQNAGGGKAGLADRKGGKAGGSRKVHLSAVQAASAEHEEHAGRDCLSVCFAMNSADRIMQAHYDSKHPKDVLDPAGELSLLPCFQDLNGADKALSVASSVSKRT